MKQWLQQDNATFSGNYFIKFIENMSLSAVSQERSSRGQSKNPSGASSPLRKDQKNVAQELKLIQSELVNVFDQYEKQRNLSKSLTLNKFPKTTSGLEKSPNSIITKKSTQGFFQDSSNEPRLSPEELKNAAKNYVAFRNKTSLTSMVDVYRPETDRILTNASQVRIIQKLNSETFSPTRPITQQSMPILPINSQKSLRGLDVNLRTTAGKFTKMNSPARTFSAINHKRNQIELANPTAPDLKQMPRVKTSPKAVARLRIINTQRTTAATERTHYNLSTQESRVELLTTARDSNYKSTLTNTVADEIDAVSRRESQTERHFTTTEKGIFDDGRYDRKKTNFKNKTSDSMGNPIKWELGPGGIYKRQVSEAEKLRFSGFITNEFVNELIVEKHHRMVEEKKMNSFEEIRKIIIENRNIRLKFQETIEEFEKDYKEQLSRRKKYEQFREVDPKLPKGYPKQQFFEIFPPDLNAAIGMKINPKPLLAREQKKLTIKMKPYELKLEKELIDFIKNLERNEKKHEATLLYMEGRQKAERIFKNKYKRLRKALKQALHRMGNLKMPLAEIIERQIFTTKPYQKQGSHDFIKCAKFGDYNKMRAILQFNKYMIYEYDQMQQTAMHWAAKRGFSDIIELLLEHHADMEAEDMVKLGPYILLFRLARHLCIMQLEESISTVLELCCIIGLLHGADTNISIIKKYVTIICALRPSVWPDRYEVEFKNKKKLDIILSFHEAENRDTIWAKKAKMLFDDERKAKNLLTVGDMP